MNVAIVAVLFLVVAGVCGAFLRPTEAEVQAASIPPPASADSHDDHGHHSHSQH